MRSDTKATRALLALGKAVEATFSRGDWLELGLITDTEPIIREHRRLLRSLEWGDEDYHGHVLDVLPAVLGDRGRSRASLAVDRFPNLSAVEERVGLSGWLAANDRALWEELYTGEESVALDELDEAARRLGLPDIDAHAARIRFGLRNDPAQAIGSAKELLETTLKAILDLHGTGKETKLEISDLIKRANVKLGLDPSAMPESEPGAAQRRKVLGAIGQIVYGVAELRNAGLGTGHGVSRGPTLDVATARMVVSAAVTAATFYAEANAAVNPSEERNLPF